MKNRTLKKLMTAVMAATLVFGIGSTPARAAEGDFTLDGMNKTQGDPGDYVYAWVSTDGAASDLKYLQFTYTGDITSLRLEDTAGHGPVWFNSDQANHFVTPDGSGIPLTAAEETTVTVDLESAGLQLAGTEDKGFHMHYGDDGNDNEGFVITDAKLTNALPGDNEQQTPPADEGQQTPPADEGQQTPPADEGQQTPPADGGQQTPAAGSAEFALTGDANGKSSMNGTFACNGAYKYLGWVTTDGAATDMKYLQFTYTGDISCLRLEFEGDGGTSAAVWFNPDQEKHFVAKDGGAIPMNPTEATTITVDLAASGIDFAKYNKGFHMHYGDGADPSTFNGTFTVTDAKLTGGTAPTNADAPKTDNKTSGTTGSNGGTKAPKTGSTAVPTAVAGLVILAAAAGLYFNKKRA